MSGATLPAWGWLTGGKETAVVPAGCPGGSSRMLLQQVWPDPHCTGEPWPEFSSPTHLSPEQCLRNSCQLLGLLKTWPGILYGWSVREPQATWEDIGTLLGRPRRFCVWARMPEILMPHTRGGIRPNSLMHLTSETSHHILRYKVQTSKSKRTKVLISFLNGIPSRISSCDYANYTFKHNQYLNLLELDQVWIHPWTKTLHR